MFYISVSSPSVLGPERKVKINSEGKYPALKRDFAQESCLFLSPHLALFKPWRTVCFVCGGDSLG